MITSKHMAVLGLCLASMSMSLFAAEPTQGNEPSREELQRKLDEAQERLNIAAREVAELSMSLSEGVMGRLGPPGPNRAVLGIALSPSRAQREEGVEVASVSPGGGAAEAGLKAGDLLTEVNGTKLTREAGRSPQDKLLELMRAVKPNEKVRVRYRREGKAGEAEITARPLQTHFFARAFPPAIAQGVPAHAAFFRADGVFGNTELVAMTPKLGQYFGTDKGLLVVRAPQDARLKLEEGDVILDIDGRTPSSASHAFRILSSYQEGEQLELTVMRNKKRLTFNVTVPEAPAFKHHIQRGFGPALRVRPGSDPGEAAEMVAPATPLPPAVVIHRADDTV